MPGGTPSGRIIWSAGSCRWCLEPWDVLVFDVFGSFPAPVRPLPSTVSMSGTPNQIHAVPRLRGRTPIRPDDLLLSVLVPVYNERSTIGVIIGQIHTVGVRKQVICVDDRSTDGTMEILEKLKAQGHIDVLVRHEVNRGKGAAIRTALAASTVNVVIVQDSDL